MFIRWIVMTCMQKSYFNKKDEVVDRSDRFLQGHGPLYFSEYWVVFRCNILHFSGILTVISSKHFDAAAVSIFSVCSYSMGTCSCLLVVSGKTHTHTHTHSPHVILLCSNNSNKHVSQSSSFPGTMSLLLKEYSWSNLCYH